MQKRLITTDLLFSLPAKQIEVLASQEIQELLIGGYIRIDELLVKEAVDAMFAIRHMPAIVDAIKSGRLTFAELTGATTPAATFTFVSIGKLVAAGKMQWEQLLHLTGSEQQALLDNGVRKAIEADKITVGQVLRFLAEGRLGKVVMAMVE